MAIRTWFPSPIGAFFYWILSIEHFLSLRTCFRPLLGLFFIEFNRTLSKFTNFNNVSVPYWGFFLLNLSSQSLVNWYGKVVSVPYWGFFLLNWSPCNWLYESINTVSVPYWGFFLLNHLSLTFCIDTTHRFPSPIGAFFYWILSPASHCLCLF